MTVSERGKQIIIII